MLSLDGFSLGNIFARQQSIVGPISNGKKACVVVFPSVLLVLVHGPLQHCFSGLRQVGKPHHFCLCRYYSRYTYSSHSFGYSFSSSLKVLGVRAIVLGFRVRVRVRVRIRIRGLGDQNYEVGFETIGTVTQNYAL